MKILMVGGTGLISSAVSNLLLHRGHEVDIICLNDGLHPTLPLEGARFHYIDVNDEENINRFLATRTYDTIVDSTVMTPQQARRDIRLFAGKTAQYVFISSASAYQKPLKHYPITEETPLENPFWDYSRNKAECERILLDEYRAKGFPATIVRPSLTYGDLSIPYVMNNWGKQWSLIHRIQQGKRVIVPGDGTSLWTITHNTDFAKGFVGLLGNKKAIGEAFHITSDEVLTWDETLNQIGAAAGREPKPVHISSEFIIAFQPDQLGNLLGDKSVSAVFDNSKLRSLVPDFKATVPFQEGIARSIDYFRNHPELQSFDEAFEQQLDRIIAAHDFGISMAKNVQ